VWKGGPCPMRGSLNMTHRSTKDRITGVAMRDRENYLQGHCGGVGPLMGGVPPRQKSGQESGDRNNGGGSEPFFEAGIKEATKTTTEEEKRMQTAKEGVSTKNKFEKPNHRESRSLPRLGKRRKARKRVRKK